MKIVFYNTSSMKPTGSSISYFPKRADIWDELADKYPQHEFVLITTRSAVYLMDKDTTKLSDKIKYVFIDNEHNSPDEIVELIKKQAPAVAVAISTPSAPIDWNFLKDAVIGEKLEETGIKVISHKVFTAIAFYDKWRSQIALRQFGFGYAKGIYIHNDQFNVEKNMPAYTNNVYKEYVLHRVSQFNYPVIIKDTIGSGSLGLQVAENFEQAKTIITSDKNTSDLMVEEMIQGESFGTEIHGVEGHYHVLPPFKFSMNDEGITDPLQSVKFGPVTAERYNIPQLQESLRRLAESFHFAGSAQVDLIFRDGKWYIIEVNPRWSGMTTTVAAAEDRNPFAIYAESALESEKDYSKWENLKYTLNFKISETDDETLEKLNAHEHVKFIMVTKSSYISYCEVVLSGFDTKEDMLAELDAIKAEFPELVSDIVVKNARTLAAEG